MTVCTSPGPTLGVVGGGQLGRMLGEAAAPLGVELVVLDPTPDCPASPVVREQVVGDFDDPAAVKRLAEVSDALTFEIELADPDLLASAAGGEDDVPVHPAPATLRVIQDKLTQNRFLEDHGIPVPAFRAADDAEDLRAVLEELGTPAMVKARRGGYDGRGNLPIEDPADAESTMAAIGGPAVVERFVPFERELSVIGVRGVDGVRTYVVGENVHREEILRETIVPARTDEGVRELAREVALDVLGALEGRGTYGIELFETADGGILVNEIAPRPHNSGHWTIEGAPTSQFEQHVRAVMGMPLGPTEPHLPTASVNVLGDVASPTSARLAGVDAVLERPHAHLHWYGKREVRSLRKMGHVTVVGREERDVEALLEAARTCRKRLHFET